jgi:DNA-binding transcriptional LysR family regulator
METDLFVTFIAVAKHKSVSRASEEIYLTQPAVTKQIKALERIYDIELFDRKQNKMLLTPDGKHLLEYAYQFLSLLNKSKISVNERSGPLTGTLKIAVNLTLGIYIMPKLIKLFSDLHGHLRFEVFLDNTENVIKGVKRNDVNFGLIGIDLEDALIVNHLFYQDRINLVVWRGLGIKKVYSWKELEKLPFIQREKGSDIRESYEQWLKEKRINLKPVMELNNTEAIKRCIQYGIGFSLLPSCTIEQEIQSGLLRVVSAPYLDLIQRYYICHYRHKKFSKAEKTFLEFLFEAIDSGTLCRAYTPVAR